MGHLDIAKLIESHGPITIIYRRFKRALRCVQCFGQIAGIGIKPTQLYPIPVDTGIELGDAFITRDEIFRCEFALQSRFECKNRNFSLSCCGPDIDTDAFGAVECCIKIVQYGDGAQPFASIVDLQGFSPLWSRSDALDAFSKNANLLGVFSVAGGKFVHKGGLCRAQFTPDGDRCLFGNACGVLGEGHLISELFDFLALLFDPLVELALNGGKGQLRFINRRLHRICSLFRQISPGGAGEQGQKHKGQYREGQKSVHCFSTIKRFS